jgi:hypothetical protein
MQGLMNFQELAETIQAQKRRDFVGTTARMQMDDVDSFSINNEPFGINSTMHDQISDKLGIPKAYYRKMVSDDPELLKQNVNGWMQRHPQKVLVRTLDGNARAMLSNAYRPLDNFDLMNALLPMFEQHQQLGLQVRDCGLTESYMHVKATVAANKAEVKVGDVVEAGVLVSNSEIGKASLRVEPMVFRLVCSNGAVSNSAIRQFHLGRRQDGGDNVEELLTDRTKLARDMSFWMQVRDVIRHVLSNPRWIQDEAGKLREASEQIITRPVPELIEVSQKMFGFSQQESDTLLDRLVRGQDFSRYGFYNGVTNMAQSVGEYDRRIEIERVGQQVIELPPNKWRELSAVAN